MSGSVAGVRAVACGGRVCSRSKLTYLRWLYARHACQRLPASALERDHPSTQPLRRAGFSSLARTAHAVWQCQRGPVCQVRVGSVTTSGHHCWQGLASLSLVAGWAVLTADRTDGPVVCHWVNKWGPLKSGSARAVTGRYARPRGSARAARARASASPRALQRCGQGARAGSLLSPQLCLNLRQHSISHECDQHFL